MRTVNFRLISLRPLNHYRKKNKDELLAYRLGRLLLEELVDGLLVVSLALAEADDARLERVVPRLTLVLVFRRHPAENDRIMASNESFFLSADNLSNTEYSQVTDDKEIRRFNENCKIF